MRSDCPPQRLLEFLASEAGLAANNAAEVVASSKAEEDALLEQARLGACGAITASLAPPEITPAITHELQYDLANMQLTPVQAVLECVV